MQNLQWRFRNESRLLLHPSVVYLHHLLLQERKVKLSDLSRDLPKPQHHKPNGNK
jgi:hypothetical protein